MDVEKFLLLVKDHEAIYDASRCVNTGIASYFYDDVLN
jgi:hypothetical protein